MISNYILPPHSKGPEIGILDITLLSVLGKSKHIDVTSISILFHWSGEKESYGKLLYDKGGFSHLRYSIRSNITTFSKYLENTKLCLLTIISDHRTLGVSTVSGSLAKLLLIQTLTLNFEILDKNKIVIGTLLLNFTYNDVSNDQKNKFSIIEGGSKSRSVNALDITVDRVILNPHVFDVINESTPKIKFGNRDKKSSLSFCLSLSLPFLKVEPTTICSKKSKFPSKAQNEIIFSKTTNFKLNVENIGENSESFLKCKLFSRLLHQRTPNCLGEMSFRLKHLFSKSKLSQPFKLPIWASPFLLPLINSEIIGDIILFVSLTYDTKCSFRPMLPVPKERKNVEVLQSQSKTKEFISEEYLSLCLKVNRGRNFCLEFPINLYVSLKFFSLSNENIRSDVIWYNSRPDFQLLATSTVALNQKFFKRTRNNHLFIEIWNYISDENQKMIGMASIALHQLYLAFHTEDQRKAVFKQSHPVIIVNDWIPVRDALTSFEVGQIQVVLTAGTYEQIHHHLKGSEGIYESVADSDSEPYYETLNESPSEIKNISKETSTDENPTSSPSLNNSEEFFEAEVLVEEGRHFPKEPPSRQLSQTYITFLNYRSSSVNYSSSPIWNHKDSSVFFPTDLLSLSNDKCLILKAWISSSKYTSDEILSFSSIDLKSLAHGLPFISGWYSMLDSMGRSKGQIKISITPLVNQKKRRSHDSCTSFLSVKKITGNEFNQFDKQTLFQKLQELEALSFGLQSKLNLCRKDSEVSSPESDVVDWSAIIKEIHQKE